MSNMKDKKIVGLFFNNVGMLLLATIVSLLLTSFLMLLIKIIPGVANTNIEMLFYGMIGMLSEAVFVFFWQFHNSYNNKLEHFQPCMISFTMAYLLRFAVSAIGKFYPVVLGAGVSYFGRYLYCVRTDQTFGGIELKGIPFVYFLIPVWFLYMLLALAYYIAFRMAGKKLNAEKKQLHRNGGSE